MVRLLENLHPESASVGQGMDPSDELIRFAGNFNLAFPAGDIQEIYSGKEGENPVQAQVNFLGLGGPFGPLPIAYNQLILERYVKKDRGILSFFNNFNHRLISLFYRALKHFKPAVDGTSVETESFARHVFSILGIDGKHLKNRLSAPDQAILGYGSIFLSGSNSGGGLESLLSKYFQTDIKVEPFIGEWNPIPKRQWTRLAAKGTNNALGSSFVLGTRAWLDQSRFSIEIDSLPLDKYLDLLPTGSAFKQAVDLTRFYAGREHDFDLLLGIKPNEVPGTRLGGETSDKTEDDFPTITEPRLGWNFILRTTSEPPEARPKARIFAF